MRKLNKNKNIAPGEDILFLLDPAAAKPDGHFKQALWEEISTQSSSNNLLINLAQLMNKKQTALMFSTLFVTIVAAGGVLLVNNRPPIPRSDQEILAAISAARQIQFASQEVNSLAIDGPASTSMVLPANMPGYSHQKYSITAGPRIDNCTGVQMFYGVRRGQLESWSYFRGDAYFYKSTTTDHAGNLVNYTLTSPDAQIQYAGGDYAIEMEMAGIAASSGISDLAQPDLLESENVQTDPSRQSAINDNLIPMETDSSVGMLDESVFSNAELEKVRKDGVDYYISTWEDKFLCDGHKVVFRTWTEATNLDLITIEREEMYLNSVSPANLISERVLTVNESRDDFDAAELKEIFEFEFDVPIKLVEFMGLQVQDQKELKEYLIALNLDIPRDKVLEIHGISKGVAFSEGEFLTDRAYYAPGKAGETRYQEQIKEWTRVNEALPLVAYSEQDGQLDDYFTGVSVYSSDSISAQGILDSKLIGNVQPKAGSITISSQEYKVKVYEPDFRSIFELDPEDGSTPIEVPSIKVTILELNGKIYVWESFQDELSEMEWINTKKDIKSIL